MTDVAVLNALLTAEFQILEAYTVGGSVLISPPAGDPNASLASNAALIGTHFKNQHEDHAVRLQTLITALDGTPVNQATVLFTPPATFAPTVINVIKLWANLEQSAAVFYSGALQTLTAQTNAATAAAIGGVEAQHFIWWYLLANGLITFGADAVLDANDVVPTSFTTSVGAGTTGLDGVPDFTYT